MSKQVQVVQTSSGFYIQIDGRDVDGPLSQRELIDEMRHYNNDPSYKILPPRKMNAYSNVKKGDRVSVKGAKKYDALSPDTVAGTVLFIHPDGKVAVRVGSGQMNVLPQDIVNSYSNGRQRAMNAISEKLNAFKLGYKGEAEVKIGN